MAQVQFTPREFVVYAMLLNAGIGFILGLIPLLFGYFNRRLRTGVIAILTTTLGGAVLGILLILPATIFFTWLVHRQAKGNNVDEAPPVDTN